MVCTNAIKIKKHVSCFVKQPKDHIGFRTIIKSDAGPHGPVHPEGRHQIGSGKTGLIRPAALKIAAFDHDAAFRIPLAHEKGKPFPTPRFAKHGKAGEIRLEMAAVVPAKLL